MRNTFLKENKFLSKIFLILGLLILGSILFSGAVSAASLANTPQPKIHHDNNNTGQSEYNGPTTNTTKWKYQTGDLVSSSPVIGNDGTVYFGSWDSNLYAVNPKGTLKWKYRTGDIITSSPSIGNDGTVYVGSTDGYLYAIYPTGTLKWKYQTGASISQSSAAIDNEGTVYVGSGDSYLYAINPTGTLKWKYQTGDGIISSPAIGNDGTVYVGSHDHYLYAINPTGTLKWRYLTGYFLESSPSIGSDGTIYIGCEDFNLYAINPDGTLKWKFLTGYMIDSTPAIGNDGTIYIGSYDHYLYAVNPTGLLKWKFQTGDLIYSSPAIGNDGTVYVGSYDHYLYALTSTGALKWRYQTENSISSSPAIGKDGTLFVGSFDRYLYALADITVSANPSGGQYTGVKQVTLSTNLPGTIYYEIYNSNSNTGWIQYTSSITIKNSCNLTFYAVDSDGNTSPITTEVYNMNFLPPTVSSNVPSGLFNKVQEVILTTNSDTDTTTYYTTDGTDPQTSGTRQVYTGPIIVSDSITLRFSALDTMGSWSPNYTENIIITPPKDTTAPTVISNPSPGLHRVPLSVTLTTTDPDSTFTTYYTTDGTDPQTSVTRHVYTGLINILQTTTLRFSAVDPAGNWGPNYINIYTIDMTPPTIINSLNGGTYNKNQTATLTTTDPDSIYTTYYTTDGTDPETSGSRLIYTSPISINKSSTLRYIAIDPAGNWGPEYIQTYSIVPTVTANPRGGLYNTTQTVTLTMSESGSIYYTLNGTTPTNKSLVYTKPIVISSTTVLKYIAIDNFANKSTVGTQTYTIDKISPKVVSTTPANNTVNVSLTTPVTIKFGENIFAGANYSNIYIKNLSTGKLIAISKTIKGNTLTLGHGTLSKNTNYLIYIPTPSVKDKAGNTLKTPYLYKFKTKT